MKPPRVILFDFGDTLVETEPLYVERLRLSLAEEGYTVSYEDMERAYLEADWRSAMALVNKKPFPAEAWRGLFMAIMFETLNIRGNIRELLERVANRMGTIVPTRKLVEGVEEFLGTCSDRGIRTAVLSNNDGRTREKAREAGIETGFELIMDSTIEKTCKPDPDFFYRALDRLKADPVECLHVGDLLGCDVIGAQAARIKTAWFHRRKYTPQTAVKPDISFDNYGQLAGLIGIK